MKFTHESPRTGFASDSHWLVKDIKVSSSIWIQENNLFPGFNGWQEGYSAFTYSIKEKNELVNYIDNQQPHHKTKTFREELIDLFLELGIGFIEKYLLWFNSSRVEPYTK